MQVNLPRKLSDSSLISHASINDREEIDKYNNRPPIRKIATVTSETELKSNEKSMDPAAAKKVSLSRDYKSSTFFTGFHHKAYLENVHIAQSKSRSNCRPRSTSPILPPIPYLKKPPQNPSPSPKISGSPRYKFIREFPQLQFAENIITDELSNEVPASRATSPTVGTNQHIAALEDTPTEAQDDLERSTSEAENEEDPKQNEPLEADSDQPQKGYENSPLDETVTPSKILRHFRFKHKETNGIPKDIPEKLLNRSQRSQFDQAFREIVQSGKAAFEPRTQIKEKLVTVGLSPRTFQDVQTKHGSKCKGEKEILNELLLDSKCGQENDQQKNDISAEQHTRCKYGENFQKGDSEEISRRCDDGIVQENFYNGNGIGSARQTQLLDQSRGTRSEDGFYKKGYEHPRRSSILKSNSEGIFQTPASKIQGQNDGSKFDKSCHDNVDHKTTMEEPIVKARACLQPEADVSTKLQDQNGGFRFRDKFHNTADNKRSRVEPIAKGRGKSRQRLNLPQDLKEDLNIFKRNHASEHPQFGNVNQTKRSPNSISQLLYYNYGQCRFDNSRKVTSTASQGSVTSIAMEKSYQPMEEQASMSKLLQELNSDQEQVAQGNHNKRLNTNRCQCNQPNGCSEQLEKLNVQTWKYYQCNDLNEVLEARQKVSTTSITFNGPKRPSSVPPLKKPQRRYQNPREIDFVNPNNNFEEKLQPVNKTSIVESIRKRVFQSPGAPLRNEGEPKTWEEEQTNRGENLKFPRETKNAVMMMLSGANSKVSWRNDENHQARASHVQTQSGTKPNPLKNCTQLPCTKNLLCEKGIHSGKCRKYERILMLRNSKPCLCRERRLWCPECQNIWPGSAKRCEEISSEEIEPDEAFLQIMEPQKLQKFSKTEKCVPM